MQRIEVCFRGGEHDADVVERLFREGTGASWSPVAAALIAQPGLWASGVGVEQVERVAAAETRVSIALGGSLEDAWAAAFLTLEATRACPSLWATLESSEGDQGDFLLVEAADFLPEWCSPDVMAERIFITAAGVCLLPPTPLITPDIAQSAHLLTGLWQRHGIRGRATTGDNGAVSEAGGVGEVQPEEARAFIEEAVMPAFAESASPAAAAEGRTDAHRRALNNAVVRSVSLSDVAAAIEARAAAEAQGLVNTTQRVCLVVPDGLAFALQQRPDFGVRAAHAAAAAFLHEADDGIGGELSRISAGCPFMPTELGELVKVSVRLPRFTFAEALFAPLPEALGAEPLPNPPHRAPRELIAANLGAKVAVGAALLLERGDQCAGELARSLTCGDAAGGVKRDITVAAAGDFGDGFQWIDEYAAAAAEREAQWAKSDVFGALAAEIADGDADDALFRDTDSDDDDDGGGQTTAAKGNADDGQSDSDATAATDSSSEDADGGDDVHLAGADAAGHVVGDTDAEAQSAAAAADEFLAALAVAEGPDATFSLNAEEAAALTASAQWRAVVSSLGGA